MRTIPLLADVPALAHLERVRQSAAKLPDEAQFFKAGICDDARQVIAVTTFTSFDQISMFSAQLAHLGLRALILGDDDEMQGCDVIFVKNKLADGQMAD